jgi:hypothetical protein
MTTFSRFLAQRKDYWPGVSRQALCFSPFRPFPAPPVHTWSCASGWRIP